MKLGVFLEDDLSISSGSIKLSIKSQLEKYREKYDALIKNKKIITESYRVMPAGYTIVWCKIPSQSLDKFYYDVLLQLTPGEEKTFEDCEVKFFSNSPSFIYGGYAYIFYHMDSDNTNPGKGMMIDQFRQKIPRDNLLIPKSVNKLGKDPVTEEPIVRNRLGIPMPDFSIYCAIFHLIDNLQYNQVMKVRSYRTVDQIVNSVKNFDQLMFERKRQAAREKNIKDRKRSAEQKAVSKTVKQYSPGTGMKTTQSAKGVMKPRSMTSSKTNRRSSKGVNKIG